MGSSEHCSSDINTMNKLILVSLAILAALAQGGVVKREDVAEFESVGEAAIAEDSISKLDDEDWEDDEDDLEDDDEDDDEDDLEDDDDDDEDDLEDDDDEDDDEDDLEDDDDDDDEDEEEL